jgi:hypothetical protein
MGGPEIHKVILLKSFTSWWGELLAPAASDRAAGGGRRPI